VGSYEDGELKPEVELTGRFATDSTESDVDGVLEEIKAVLFRGGEAPRTVR